MRKICEALQIFIKYDSKGVESVSAAHDELWAGGPSPDKMEPGDASKLDTLGWLWDETYESWQKYV